GRKWQPLHDRANGQYTVQQHREGAVDRCRVRCADDGGTGVGDPVGIAVDGSGNVLVVDANTNSVVKIPWTGTAYGAQTTVPTTGLSGPTGLALDGSGDVYVADTTNGRVIKVAWNGATYGAQTTVATGLDSDEGVAVDGSGNVKVDVADP